jgi:hypothetical protein
LDLWDIIKRKSFLSMDVEQDAQGGCMQQV